MYRFSSYVLALLLLVASGQVMAAACATAANGKLDAIAAWGGVTAGATDCATPGAWKMSTSADTLAISHALIAPDADVIAKSVAILVATGKLTLGARKLTLYGDFSNAVATAADVALATSTVEFAATAAVTGASVTTFANLSVSAGGLTLAGNTIVGGNLVISGTGYLAPLAATNTIGGNIDVSGSGGTIAGGALGQTAVATGSVLKFTDASHEIKSSVNVTIQNLDVSAGTGGDTITFTPSAGTITVSSFVKGGTVAAVGTDTVTLVCNGVVGGTLTPYVIDNATAAAAAGTIASTYTCAAASTIAAPIFSTTEKAKVFAEEIKH